MASAHMIIEHDGTRIEVSGRLAEIIALQLAARDAIERPEVGHLEVYFDGRRVHPLQLTEKLIRRS